MVAPISLWATHSFPQTRPQPTGPTPPPPSTLSFSWWSRWLSSWKSQCPDLSACLSSIFSQLNTHGDIDDAGLQGLTRSLRWIGANPRRSHSRIAWLMRECLEAMPEEGIDQWLAKVVAEEVHGKDETLLDHCWPLFSIKKLRQVCEYVYQRELKLEDLAEELAITLPQRKVCHWNESLKTELGQQISAINRFLRHFADLHALSFGLNSLGRPISSQWEAGQQLSVYYMLFSLPFTLFGGLVAFGFSLPVATGLTLLGLFSVFWGLKGYFLLWRPCPDELGHGLNLVNQVKHLKFPPAIGRDGEVEQVIQALAAGNRPLLIGPSGVGKTEIMKGVAYRIAQGDVPPSLQNKKIFLINSGTLHEDAQFNYMSRLKMITERLKGFEDHVILFFDEFQALFEEGTVADQFKSACDEEIKLCAGALPERDHSSLPATGVALLRRFLPIEVKEMEDDALRLLLEEIALHAASNLHLTSEAVEAILQNSASASACYYGQVSRLERALKILYQAIFASQNLDEPPTLQEKRKQLAQIQQDSRRVHGKLIFDSRDATSLHREIKELELDWRRGQWITLSLQRFLQHRTRWEDRLCRIVQDLRSESEARRDLRPLAFCALVLPLLQGSIDTLVREGGTFAITADRIHQIASTL